MSGNTRNRIDELAAAQGEAGAATLAYQGSDRNALELLNADTSAGVDYQGSDENFLELLIIALD